MLDDDIATLRAVADLGADLAGYAAMAAAGLDHARHVGGELIVPIGTHEHVRQAYDLAARVARWLPELPLPPAMTEEVTSDAQRR